MRALLISDTHGQQDYLYKVMREVGSIDMLIHCGDVCGGEEEIREISGVPCIFVRGNCDSSLSLPQDTEIFFGGQKLFITHGDGYGVNMSIDRLVYAGLAREAKAVLFGHTHRPCVETAEGMWIVNPGSLSQPRQSGGKSSYIVMEAGNKGELRFELFFL